MVEAAFHREYLTPPAVAKVLGVSADTVLGWIHSGELPAFNVASPGKRPMWKVADQHLAEFIRRRLNRQPELSKQSRALDRTVTEFFQ